MQLIEKIISIVAPHICLGCGLEVNRLVCEACVQEITPVPSRCYRCKAVTDNYATCDQCSQQTPLKQVLVLAHHDGLARKLIHHLKYGRAQAGSREAAQLMLGHLDYLDEGLLVEVPTATSRVRMRGYDHAVLLASELADLSRWQQSSLLARVGQTQQMGSNRAKRLRQLESAFRPIHADRISGAHVILVDDVLTTGATLETAARILRRAGAKRVDAIVFAQA
ncbi:MAG: phosphoribosyltransferase family protein [Candidatus Saccharimonadales bacterium]